MENYQNETFLKRLESAMRMSNMRQVDLSKLSGIPKGQLSQYMTGKYVPKKSTLKRIADTLGVSELWLMGYDVPMTAETDPETVRNQVIADITLRMQTDNQYKDAVLKLDKLDQKQLAAIVAILDTMVK